MIYNTKGKKYLGYCVGKKVLVTLSQNRRHNKQGIIEAIDDGDSTALIRFQDDNTIWFKLEHLKTLAKTQSILTNTNSEGWKFHLQSSTAIDWDLIAQDLCAEHPMQLVTVKRKDYDEKRYVILHHSLLTKASVCDISIRMYTSIKILDFMRINKGMVYTVPTDNNVYSLWIKGIKAIIAAPWPDGYKDHPEITVVSPI